MSIRWVSDDRDPMAGEGIYKGSSHEFKKLQFSHYLIFSRDNWLFDCCLKNNY
jgi:hypothetical protein